MLNTMMENKIKIFTVFFYLFPGSMATYTMFRDYDFRKKEGNISKTLVSVSIITLNMVKIPAILFINKPFTQINVFKKL